MTHREYKLVPYGSDQYFNLVLDVDRYKDFLPFCKVSRVIKCDLVSSTPLLNTSSPSVVITPSSFSSPSCLVGNDESFTTSPTNENDDAAGVMLATLSIAINLFNESYTSRIEYDNAKKSIVVSAADSKIFSQLVTSWQFIDSDCGGCYVDFSMMFEFSSFLHQQAIGLFVDGIARHTLESFNKRAQELYGEPHERRCST